MVESLRTKLAKLIAPEPFEDIERQKRELDAAVDQRVAQAVSKLDPFEFLMREFHGVFSQEYERAEEELDEKGKLMMELWGWQQHNDAAFDYMTKWIMNRQANETLKRAPVTPKRILYGRAQISGMVLFRREVGRLASLYEQRTRSSKEFNSNIPVE